MNDSPPLRAGADIAGVASEGDAGGTDPGSIACIAPSDNDCRPAVAGCPVVIPVMTDCPIGPGEKPCPRAAGDRGPPGTPGAPGAIGALPPIAGAPPLSGGAAGAPAGTGPPLPGPRGTNTWRRSAGQRPALAPPAPPLRAARRHPAPDSRRRRRHHRRPPPRRHCRSATAPTGPPAPRRIQVVLADLARRWNIVGIEAVLTRPSSGVSMDTFGVEDLLRGRHDFVDGGARCLRRISIAPRLDRLYLC